MGEKKLVEVFYDYICPWCYLGTANTDRLRKERDIKFRWTLYPLHPEIPLEGIELDVLFGKKPKERDPGKARLKEAAAGVGLPLKRRTRVCYSRRAQELEKWAVSLGKGDEYRSRTFQAYFAEGKDIARLEVLEEITEHIGLPPEDVWEVLTVGYFSGAVDDDWIRARQLGVSAVPFYIVGEKPLVGFRPFADLLKLVDEP